VRDPPPGGRYVTELRPWGRNRLLRHTIVRELIVFSHGAIAHLAFDREPEDVLERFAETIDELRAFLFSTRARG